ncbi:Seven TM Receptor [Caenorhabditis elegans]|uniref:Seven TM Receptor n=1 Tax=Caenorhabditis elegans TaxID=6239 RepID=O45971_CAEEL|nr:Seven TM Receptor [Caenorhabditis elegans]CAA15965.1 Seven TM Receptor [Caenorhabditis elegans]|eukprot:NP_506907.1 Uncharacterized protein CELE_Y6E2A.1 [Caenorhabditis elegans]
MKLPKIYGLIRIEKFSQKVKLEVFQKKHKKLGNSIFSGIFKNKQAMIYVLGMYCSCYGMMLSLLTINFYYRYLSVTCPSKLSRFSLKFVPIWTFIVLINSFAWFSICYFVNGPSKMKDLHVYPEFLKSYCMKPDEFAYASAQYFYEDPVTGELTIHFRSLLATGAMAMIMTFTLSAILYFGMQTYKHLYRLSSIAGLDNREIQNQLFRTLVVQTAIPFIFMYFPVSVMFLLPLFGIKVEELGNIVPISVAIYPCFEPLVAMFFIKNFRYRIIGEKLNENLAKIKQFCRCDHLQQSEENDSSISATNG